MNKRQRHLFQIRPAGDTLIQMFPDICPGERNRRVRRIVLVIIINEITDLQAIHSTPSFSRMSASSFRARRIRLRTVATVVFCSAAISSSDNPPMCFNVNASRKSGFSRGNAFNKRRRRSSISARRSGSGAVSAPPVVSNSGRID